MPYLVDTHVHLDHPRLDLDAAIKAAEAAGVKKMINIGHDMESCLDSVELSRKFSQVWATVGYHPHSAKDMGDAQLERIKELAAQPKVVAIGEIGLDYHYDYSPRDVQRKVFRTQMELAEELKLPVVIHQREAVKDTMDILKDFSPLPNGGVMHCFSGTLEIAKEAIDMGLYIGLGGPVTFTNAKKPKEVAAGIPLEKLVLETDCPWLSPHPHRGKTNQPGYLPLIAQEIAELRGMPVDQLITACTANSERLFGI